VGVICIGAVKELEIASVKKEKERKGKTGRKEIL